MPETEGRRTEGDVHTNGAGTADDVATTVTVAKVEPDRYRVTVVASFYVDLETDPYAQVPRASRQAVRSAARAYIRGLVTVLHGQRIRTDVFVVKYRQRQQPTTTEDNAT